MIAGAAMAGLFAGALTSHSHASVAFGKSAGKSPAQMDKDKASCKGPNGCSSAGKHDCSGKNACKGQGGCKSGDNGCKGKNSCKGKGGCSTSNPM